MFGVNLQIFGQHGAPEVRLQLPAVRRRPPPLHRHALRHAGDQGHAGQAGEELPHRDAGGNGGEGYLLFYVL